MINFFNIRSGETIACETEPQIAAMYNSSDRGVNANLGQDFGWRLAPEVIIEMERIFSDPFERQAIATQFRMPAEDIVQTDVLSYISDRTPSESAPVADMTDYTDEYSERVKRLRVRATTEAQRKAEAAAARDTVPTTTETTTESLADMRERVELAERLAAANATPVVTTTTTAAPVKTTTSTTTKS